MILYITTLTSIAPNHAMMDFNPIEAQKVGIELGLIQAHNISDDYQQTNQPGVIRTAHEKNSLIANLAFYDEPSPDVPNEYTDITYVSTPESFDKQKLTYLSALKAAQNNILSEKENLLSPISSNNIFSELNSSAHDFKDNQSNFEPTAHESLALLAVYRNLLENKGCYVSATIEKPCNRKVLNDNVNSHTWEELSIPDNKRGHRAKTGPNDTQIAEKLSCRRYPLRLSTLQKTYKDSSPDDTYYDEEEYTPTLRRYKKKKPYERKSIQHRENTLCCPFCPITVPNYYFLQKHKMNAHGIVPFRCNECSMNFISRSELEKHRRVHTNEKPFHCPSCNRYFKQSSHLYSHQTKCRGEKKIERSYLQT